VSATLHAAWAGARRRRLQTLAVMIVVLASTTATMLSLAMVLQSHGAFQRVFDQRHGAHVVALFDPATTPAGALATPPSQVSAHAGPFPVTQATFTVSGLTLPPASVVGRADPQGPVDDLVLAAGRWPDGPGQIALSRDLVGKAVHLGSTVTVAAAPGHPNLTVVGIASSISGSADAWVTPAQAVALTGPGVPGSEQMLYRLGRAGTDTDVADGVKAIAATVPHGALLSTQSYLPALRSAQRPSPTEPFLSAFAVLGLVVAVLIVANVVSGAVVAGFRTIGVMKTLGFTPAQVVAAHALQIVVPALAASALGTLAGLALSGSLLDDAASAQGLPATPAMSPWVIAAALAGIPLVAGLAALGPAIRAGRMSAIEAITTGRAPRADHGYAVTRLLSRVALPRPVSLGLATPFRRPARSAITLVAILLGATTVIFATGLTWSLSRAVRDVGRPQVQIQASAGDAGAPAGAAAAAPSGTGARPPIDRGDASSAIRALPGTRDVAAIAVVSAQPTQSGRLAAAGRRFDLAAIRAGGTWQGYQLTAGHWPQGPAQAIVTRGFLESTGAALGDRIGLDVRGRPLAVVLVGEYMGAGDWPSLITDWSAAGTVLPDLVPDRYEIALTPGTDAHAYAVALTAARPGLSVLVTADTNRSVILQIWIPLALVLTLSLAAVAAFGVFNTVLLNTRERAHELAVLKSLGMAPAQTVALALTSVAGMGLVAGLLAIPLGVTVHAATLSAMGDASDTALPASLVQVYPAVMLGVLALSGVVIAVLGGLTPALWAARSNPAGVLHGE
jgi:putative ABC transport system permease protein